MKTLRSSGFTLVEVIIGSAMLGMAAFFMVNSLVVFMRTETAMMAKENLSLVEENLGRNVLGNLVNFSLDASANTVSYCNFNQTNINTYLGQNFPNNITLTVVDPRNNVPPDFPDYAEYTTVRNRCLTSQTHMTSPGGLFRNTGAFYFCATARGTWQSGEAGFSAMLSQTVLVEAYYKVHNEVTGQPVTCATLGSFPRGGAPSTGTPLVAHLLFKVHTVNRTVSTRQVAATGAGMAYHKGAAALRVPLPPNPDFPAVIGDIAITPLGSRLQGGRGQPATGWGNLGSFPDCAGNVCSGIQYVSVQPLTVATATGQSVLVDIWVQPTLHVPAGSPAPANFSTFGFLQDCGDGSLANRTCNGLMTLAKRRMNWNSIPPGGAYVSGLYITPLNTHSLVGLNCPVGWVLRGFNADCGGTASGNCVGRQNICVAFATK